MWRNNGKYQSGSEIIGQNGRRSEMKAAKSAIDKRRSGINNETRNKARQKMACNGAQ